MPKKDHISLSVIRRLPRYYRFISGLEQKGVERISSQQLSKMMNVTASQIRQDFNCFGEFGLQGYGYNISFLLEEIGKILGLNGHRKMILIGAGNMGKAILSHMNFQKLGFSLIAVFDKEPLLEGKELYGQTILSTTKLEIFCAGESPEAAVLCIPEEEVLETVRKLKDLGIKAFWNFSSVDIGVEVPDILTENVHLSDSLMTLSYRMK